MDIDGWKAYKLAQWARVAGTLPGLSLSQTGQHEATFILGYSHPDLPGLEQRVIIGRPASVRAKTYTGPPGQAKAIGFVDETVIDGGENVSMKEILAIIECWRANRRYKQLAPQTERSGV